jgi:hypothetical protein
MWLQRRENVVTTLLSLLKNGNQPRSLSKILDSVFGGSRVRAAAEAVLEEALNAQAGRSAGKVLGRAVCEQVDAAMEARPAGATLEQRVEVGTLLAQNAAVQLARAAEILLAYPELQAAVVCAKESRDAAALKAARAAPNAGTEQVKQALVNVGRVAAGDAPREA